MHIKKEICCTKPLLVRDGFLVCTECGKMHRQHVTPQMISFTQNFAPVHASYSRSKRFRTKMMAALRLQMHYTLDKSLVSWLKNAESEGTLKTPEDLLFHIAQYPVSKNQRRPYLYAMYYWRALGKEIPRIETQELDQLCQEFDCIFFAFRRLNLPKPDFPYAYLFRKIVETGAYSKDVVMMTRFVRKLQCQVRQKRYHELYLKCRTSSKCSLLLVNERGEDRRDGDDSEAGTIISRTVHSESTEGETLSRSRSDGCEKCLSIGSTNETGHQERDIQHRQDNAHGFHNEEYLLAMLRKYRCLK